jgi:hypothetical protein
VVEEEPEEIADDAADKKPETAVSVKSSSLKAKGRQFRESVITRTIGHSKTLDSTQKDGSGGVKFKDTVRVRRLLSPLIQPANTVLPQDSIVGGTRASPDSRSVHSQGSGSKAGSRTSGNSKASGASSGGLTQQARTVQQMAVPSSTYDHSLSISVQAHSREPMLHRDIFGNLQEFWIHRALPLPPPRAVTSASSHEHKNAVTVVPDQHKDADFQRLAEDLMHALLSDVVSDADISAAISELPQQPTHKCASPLQPPSTAASCSHVARKGTSSSRRGH